MSYLQMTQVVMRHSHEMHVTENTQFVLSGAMAASKGKGGANFSGTLKHQFSPRLWVQVCGCQSFADDSTHKQ